MVLLDVALLAQVLDLPDTPQVSLSTQITSCLVDVMYCKYSVRLMNYSHNQV